MEGHPRRIADIGWCVQGYWPEQTPLSDVVSLPFLPITSAEKGSEMLWKLYEKSRRCRRSSTKSSRWCSTRARPT